MWVGGSSSKRTAGHRLPFEAGEVFVRAIDYIGDPSIDPAAAAAILDGNAGPARHRVRHLVAQVHGVGVALCQGDTGQHSPLLSLLRLDGS